MLRLLVFDQSTADHHKTHRFPGPNFGHDPIGHDMSEELEENISGRDRICN